MGVYMHVFKFFCVYIHVSMCIYLCVCVHVHKCIDDSAGCKSRSCCSKPRAPRGAICYSPTHTTIIPLAAVCATPCGVPICTAYIQMHPSIRSFMTTTHVPVYPENCKVRAPDFTRRYHRRRFPRRLIARRKCCQGRRAQRRGLWSRDLSLSLILNLFLACSALLQKSQP